MKKKIFFKGEAKRKRKKNKINLNMSNPPLRDLPCYKELKSNSQKIKDLFELAGEIKRHGSLREFGNNLETLMREKMSKKYQIHNNLIQIQINFRIPVSSKMLEIY